MKFFNRPVKFFVIAIIAATAIIFLNGRSRTNSFKDFFYRSLRHPQNFLAGAGFGASGIFKFIFEIKNLHGANIALIEENNRFRKEIFELKEVRRENDLLRSVLNLPAMSERRIVDATVIGRDPYSFSNFLLISRGSDAGISQGMIAVDSGGFFIGKISEVGSSVAKIRTVKDMDSNISAIDQETRVQGLVKNDLNFGLIFDMVAQDEKVNVGDIIIISPAAENIYPEPIAKVVSAERFPNKPFQRIKLSPLADIKNIEKVFIVLK